MIYRILICLYFIVEIFEVRAQEKIIVQPGEISNGLTRSEILNQIGIQNKIVLAYSSTQFENTIVKNLPKNALDLKTFIEEVFNDYIVTIDKVSPSKYIVTFKIASISISGYIASNSGEALPGATIINLVDGEAIFSDEKGFYYLETRPGEVKLEVQYVGHASVLFEDVNRHSFIHNFSLENISILPVFEKKERQITDPLTEILPTSNELAKNTILGEKDPLNILKTLPGVTPGGEGLSGLSIRGGSPDQNLILLEGMPIYESYHTASLASIFMEESVRSIDFMKAGLPARYGGRTNAVINVQLKDGNNTNRATSLHTGIQGITFFTQGPIVKEKLTYAVSLRSSWINSLIKPFKSKISLYDDINIGYKDAQVKMTYKIANTQKLSFAFYTGRDNVLLSKTKKLSSNFILGESSSFKNSNVLLSANYDRLINNKLKFNMQAGYLKYFVFSRGSYNYVENSTDTIAQYLDVINQTKIYDKQITTNLDYYISNDVKFKFGAGYIAHSYNPGVKQSITIINNIEEIFGEQDSSIRASELFAFVEGNIKVKNFIFVPGLYGVNYAAEGKPWPSLQPRIQMYWKATNYVNFAVSYTKAAQYVHLLTNSGLGLPSELWVPSTSKVPVEKSDYISINANIDANEHIQFSAATYFKKFQNLIDYVEPVDLFLNVINPDVAAPILNSQRDWENKIEIGQGRANGFELSMKLNYSKWQSRFAYHYSRSFRKFDNIDSGREYISKYDKPHNITASLGYNTSNNWLLGINWVFTTGQPFTLANEQSTAPIDPKLTGIKFLQASGRNNYRLPDFHQLSINASHPIKLKEINAKINFGLYNAYNRRNAFYIYSANINETRRFFKVSIFPILPQLDFVFTW